MDNEGRIVITSEGYADYLRKKGEQ
jgi:hypothetical protein